MGLIGYLRDRMGRKFSGKIIEVTEIEGPIGRYDFVDDFGKRPAMITYINPFGKKITCSAGIELLKRCREYKIGERFP